MVSDEMLVTLAAAGDSDAFDELVRRHRGRMHRLAWMLTHGDLEAEDIVQETFVRAFRGLSRFRRDSSFQTWVQRIAVNVIKSHFARRSRRVDTLPIHDDVEPSATLLERLATNEDLETALIRRQVIARALASLSDEVRRLVALREVHGLAYHEIAALTRLPMGTVESRIFRARRRLRPLLSPLLGRH